MFNISNREDSTSSKRLEENNEDFDQDVEAFNDDTIYPEIVDFDVVKKDGILMAIEPLTGQLRQFLTISSHIAIRDNHQNGCALDGYAVLNTETMRVPDFKEPRVGYFCSNYKKPNYFSDFKKWNALGFDHGHVFARFDYIGKRLLDEATFNYLNFVPQYAQANRIFNLVKERLVRQMCYKYGSCLQYSVSIFGNMQTYLNGRLKIPTAFITVALYPYRKDKFTRAVFWVENRHNSNVDEFLEELIIPFSKLSELGISDPFPGLNEQQIVDFTLNNDEFPVKSMDDIRQMIVDYLNQVSRIPIGTPCCGSNLECCPNIRLSIKEKWRWLDKELKLALCHAHKIAFRKNRSETHCLRKIKQKKTSRLSCCRSYLVRKRLNILPSLKSHPH